ncbi:MAG: ATP-grasp domain-containing protein [Anaerovoracaceae bacterium]|jgi:D-aspartate ligase
MKEDFIPLLFAGDINVYSMARAFYEEYRIKPYVFGKYNTGPCYDSKIMHYTANPQIDQQPVFLENVEKFSKEHKDKTILVLGCGDSYVQLISENMDLFPENVVAPYIHADMMNNLIHKEKFYKMCQENGVDYPNTFVHRKELGEDFQLPFEAPFIVKPSNGIEYWKHPFPTQKKVYKAKDKFELLGILKDIYTSGYEDSIIIQDFIPGDDTYMRVLTSYSNKHGEVKLMALGHVLLEEHTPHGIGNHAVIITEHNKELTDTFKNLLEKMQYVGFSNFDIKYDQRDGKYKVFEINTRQGRSNYYVTGAGANLAKYVVEDYIQDKKQDLKVISDNSLWLVIPKRVAFKYIKPQRYRNEMKKLISQGKYVNPLFYKEDNAFIRRLKLIKSQLGHYYKYKKYLG